MAPKRRVPKKDREPVDPYRRSGVRGLTSQMIRRAAVELKVVRRLLRKGELTAQEVRQLARPFEVKSLFKIARYQGMRARGGRVGGFEVEDETTLRVFANNLSQTLSSLESEHAQAIVAAHSADAAPATDGASPGPTRETTGSHTPSAGGLPEDAWQHEVVRFLVSRYSQEDLFDLLPEAFANAWRRSAGDTDDGFPGTAEDIADALVTLHDADLLANIATLRHRIADDLGLQRLKRFHPGSAGARGFVQRAGLPKELAGTPEPERPPSIVQVTSHRTLPELVGYQTTGRDQMEAVINDGSSAIYSVPTGGGKTRTAWEAIYNFVSELLSPDGAGEGPAKRNIVVWLAHRNELLDQACACLEDVWRSREGNASALIVRLWGHNTRDALSRIGDFDLPAHDAVVIVSTPATMAAILGKKERAPRLKAAIVERCRVVVVDEAHRAAAPSYVKIAKALRETGSAIQPVALIGLTATPFRDTNSRSGGTEETRVLKEIFGRLIVPPELEPDAQRWLVEQGILARPVFHDMATGVELDLEERVNKLLAKTGRLSAGQEELVDRWMAAKAQAAVNSPERHERILQIVLEVARDPGVRMLYFGQTVANAQLMAWCLRRAGIPAAVVSGKTRSWTRRRLIEEFRAGKIRVLCNCEVLTTGFDAPLVTHVVVARPTVSLVLYQQMIGRGLRGPRFGGTETCAIVNCIDRVKIGPLVLAHLVFRQLWEGVSDGA